MVSQTQTTLGETTDSGGNKKFQTDFVSFSSKNEHKNKES